MEINILRKLQEDIVENFGRDDIWEDVNPNRLNCYMFAIYCKEATEEIISNTSVSNFINSLAGNNVVYFGGIGRISETDEFKDRKGLLHALYNDLNMLSISIKEISLDAEIPETSVKIAFWYNFKQLKEGKDAGFHFMRQDKQDANYWIHKPGWCCKIEKLEGEPHTFNTDGVEFVGYFEIAHKGR